MLAYLKNRWLNILPDFIKYLAENTFNNIQ